MPDYSRLISKADPEPVPEPTLAEIESIGEPEKPPEPPPGEIHYPGWHLPMQKANAILDMIGDCAPLDARRALGEQVDALDLPGFKRTLSAIERVARAILRAREVLEYIPPGNEGLAKSLEQLLAPGRLEDREVRKRFLRTVQIAWEARRLELGGMYRELVEAKNPFLL